MRRQVTLLVAATTSVVLLAFFFPVASLVARVAASRAVDIGEQQLQSVIPLVALAPGPEDIALAVQRAVAAGTVLAITWPDGTVLGDPAAVGVGPAPTTAGSTTSEAGTRIVQPVTRAGDGTAVISVLVPTAELRAGVARTWLVLAGLGVLLFVLALVLADRVARSMTRPVDELATTADRLGTGDLTARTRPAGPPEVHAVGVAVNRLADRIGELLAAEREAAADLAHRLRTPLTALRLDADSLGSPVERERLMDDVDQLARTVDAVIREARRPVREGLGTGCDAVAVVGERVRFWSVLAEEEQRPVGVALVGRELPVRVARDDLAAAVDALLGNVFAHTPEGTAFRVQVDERRGGGAEVVVADTGPGLPPGVVPERGLSGAGSTGLGLDIARRTAVASGGELRISGQGGTVVVLSLGPPTA